VNGLIVRLHEAANREDVAEVIRRTGSRVSVPQTTRMHLLRVWPAEGVTKEQLAALDGVREVAESVIRTTMQAL
jgi:hypothetical protein